MDAKVLALVASPIRYLGSASNGNDQFDSHPLNRLAKRLPIDGIDADVTCDGGTYTVTADGETFQLTIRQGKSLREAKPIYFVDGDLRAALAAIEDAFELAGDCVVAKPAPLPSPTRRNKETANAELANAIAGNPALAKEYRTKEQWYEDWFKIVGGDTRPGPTTIYNTTTFRQLRDEHANGILLAR